jgi:hypothetical protein
LEPAAYSRGAGVGQSIANLLSEALARRRLAEHLRQAARRFRSPASTSAAEHYATQLETESAELERLAKELADQVPPEPPTESGHPSRR